MEDLIKEIREILENTAEIQKLLANLLEEAEKEQMTRETRETEAIEKEQMMWETEAINAQSMRHEIASVLDDFVNHFPDVLLRENLEILARILRDETEEIKNHFIYPRLVKKFA